MKKNLPKLLKYIREENLTGGKSIKKKNDGKQKFFFVSFSSFSSFFGKVIQFETRKGYLYPACTLGLLYLVSSESR